MIRIIFATLALAVNSTAAAQDLTPRNDCTAIDGGDEFLHILETAVANRDAALLLTIVDDEIKLDFGGGYGREDLRWRLDDQTDYRLWEELDELLVLGCGKVSDQELTLPWLWTQDLGLDDPFSAHIVIGRGVAVRASPDESAAVLKLIDWQAVDVLGDYFDEAGFYDGTGFAHVRLQSGQEGYVKLSKLRSEIDYRLGAVRKDGGWKITYFLAGD